MQNNNIHGMHSNGGKDPQKVRTCVFIQPVCVYSVAVIMAVVEGCICLLAFRRTVF